MLAEWIAAGQPAPTPSDPRIERLEILPEHSVLKKGADQQMLVLAHFSDGHSEDVTTLGQVHVDEPNRLPGGRRRQGEGHGQRRRFDRRLVPEQKRRGPITAPFENRLERRTFAKADRRNFIDEHVLANLERLNVPPSPPCSDGEFLRRASLDTIGMLADGRRVAGLPRRSSARRQTGPPDRRLLNRPEFVDYWSYKWSDLLLVSSARLRPRP